MKPRISCIACGRRFSEQGLRDHARDKGSPHGRGSPGQVPPPNPDAADDDDMGEVWKVRAQANAEKRAANRESSASILARAGVAFKANNFGAHLIVVHADRTVDFWPGTGLWIERGTKTRGRGVRRLLQHLGLTMPPEPQAEAQEAATS